MSTSLPFYQGLSNQNTYLACLRQPFMQVLCCFRIEYFEESRLKLNFGSSKEYATSFEEKYPQPWVNINIKRFAHRSKRPSLVATPNCKFAKFSPYKILSNKSVRTNLVSPSKDRRGLVGVNVRGWRLISLVSQSKGVKSFFVYLCEES